MIERKDLNFSELRYLLLGKHVTNNNSFFFSALPHRVTPKIIIPPKNNSIALNNYLVLTCKIQASGFYAYNWLKDGKLIREDERTLWTEKKVSRTQKYIYLTVRRMRLGDQGRYTCKVIGLYKHSDEASCFVVVK